jgi:5-methylcytosine-specific restriction protein A
VSREEFPRKVKDAAHARADGKCENKACGAPLTVGKFHFDHILPCALGGKPTLANCAVICEACHKEKTAREDVPRIRKADRQRARHIGAVKPQGRLRGPGFAKSEKTPRIEKSALPPLPRRNPLTKEIIG